MKINELMIKNEEELSFRQKLFLKTHTQIMTAGGVVVNAIVNLAQNLKQMKDEELYKEVGYSSFEEYSEQACGLKRRQAYNYIKVIEDLGEDFVHSNAQIGISKLTLLASLSEEEKVEVLERVEVEDVSVNELKQEIENLKEEMLKKEKDNKSVQDKSKNKIKQLQNEIEDLKKKSSEISKEKVKNLQEELKKKTEEYENALQQAKTSAEQTAYLRKQINLNSDKSIVEFKIKFENLQATIRDIQILIDKVPEEKREGCIQALKQVVDVLC